MIVWKNWLRNLAEKNEKEKMCNTGSELHNKRVEYYYDEYTELLDARKNQLDQNFKLIKLILWTGVTNQQAEMINSTLKSSDVIYNRADTLKSDWN